jgi:hypothetical protein
MVDLRVDTPNVALALVGVLAPGEKFAHGFLL